MPCAGITALFLCVSVVGYWAYGSAVSSFLLDMSSHPKWLVITCNIMVRGAVHVQADACCFATLSRHGETCGSGSLRQPAPCPGNGGGGRRPAQAALILCRSLTLTSCSGSPPLQIVIQLLVGEQASSHCP